MARVHNFSAGPAALPTSVLAEIADEMMDYRGCGMSVLEMSHRSSMYQQIIDDAEATLRRLLSIPDNYRVLFLQGGATLQFAGIPMNLMHRGRAGYIVTGNFANKASPTWPTSMRALPPRPQATGSTTSTSARTTPSLAPCTTSCPVVAMCRWSPMSRAASCRSRSTLSATGSFTPERRKTPAPRA